MKVRGISEGDDSSPHKYRKGGNQNRYGVTLTQGLHRGEGWAGNEGPQFAAITTVLVLGLGRGWGMKSKCTNGFGIPKENAKNDATSNKSNVLDPKMLGGAASCPSFWDLSCLHHTPLPPNPPQPPPSACTKAAWVL